MLGAVLAPAAGCRLDELAAIEAPAAGAPADKSEVKEASATRAVGRVRPSLPSFLTGFTLILENPKKSEKFLSSRVL